MRVALGAAFRRIARHKGCAVAVFAIARKLAQLIYRMLRYGQDYVDIGEKAYEAQFEARRLASLKEAARGLGFTSVEEPHAEGVSFRSERSSPPPQAAPHSPSPR